MGIFVLIAFLAAALLAAGYYFARVLIYPRVTPFDQTQENAVEWGWLDEAQYMPWPKEALSIRSPFGYDLSAVYHPVEGSRRTLVITHGITFSRWGSVKYAMLFYKRGYNILIYDLRHHGQSGGPNTSFGFYEKEDLKVVVDWAFERLGPGGTVGTLGESLGAATTLQHAAIDPRIAFAISDCSFSSLPRLLAYRLRVEYHLPPFPLLNVAEIFTWRMASWRFDQVSPIKYIPSIQTPIFFIHGQQDKYIQPQMSVEMYEAKRQGCRKLYLAPNAGHAEALVKNPLEYDRLIGEFLEEINCKGTVDAKH